MSEIHDNSGSFHHKGPTPDIPSGGHTAKTGISRRKILGFIGSALLGAGVIGDFLDARKKIEQADAKNRETTVYVKIVDKHTAKTTHISVGGSINKVPITNNQPVFHGPTFTVEYYNTPFTVPVTPEIFKLFKVGETILVVVDPQLKKVLRITDKE